MATAALPACATTLPTGPATGASIETPAASSIGAAPIDSHEILGIAQLASTVYQSFAPVLEQAAHWQPRMADVLQDIEEQFTTLLGGTGMALPDLSMLSIEPVEHTESSGFGWRDDPIRHTRRFHSGADFRGKSGTPVLAAGNGTVVFCGRMGGYGNAVDIDHGDGVLTRYAHLRRIETKKGATITAGEIIGQVGSTGRATGPHLHFEVRLHGAPVSPITAMSVAALERESPLAGRLAALSLSPRLQSTTESDVDPPRQRAKPAQSPGSPGNPGRPERSGRGKRSQVLW